MVYLGIDLGGTSIKAGLVDEKGNLRSSNQTPTEVWKGPEAIFDNLIKISRKVMAETEEPIAAVGIGVPGPVDMERGVVVTCVNLGWDQVPIAEMLRDQLGLPAFAGNDGTLAGVAELEEGALRGFDSGVVLTLGTGIGGGVVVNGKIQNGAHCIGGEIGHMIVGKNFYDCNCGRNGCLETFSSATAMRRYAAKLFRQGRKCPLLARLCGGKADRINGKMIFDAARQKDPVAKATVKRAAKYLGIGIVNLMAVYDPQRIVIGGGVSKAGEFYFDLIRKAAENARYFKQFPIPEIVPARFGNDAGIIGAALLARMMLRNGD